MTAKVETLRVDALLRALPSVSSCLDVGEVLSVRDRGEGLGFYVLCSAGHHYLLPDKNGVLRDFEEARDEQRARDALRCYVT